MSNDADLSLSTEPGGYRPSGGRRPQGGRKQTDAGRSLFINAVMVILVGGLVAAGWFIANQQQMLVMEKARLSDANERLERLEQRLAATDTALSQGGEDTKEQISFGSRKFANCGMFLTSEIAVGSRTIKKRLRALISQ